MAGVYKWIKHELREMLPGFVFFLISFSLIVVTDALTTEQYGIRPFHIVAAIVAALLVAKAMLLANILPFTNAFPNKPLIYNTLWKTGIYVLAALIVRYIEKLVEFTIKYGSLGAANRHMINEVVWSRFWAIHIWLVVLFLVFAALQELTASLGSGRLKQIFFGRQIPAED